MRGISLSLALILILIIALSSSSLLMVKPAFAQTSTPTTSVPIPTPSVPQFTVTFVDNSYYVPSVNYTTTDPYTGKQTVNIENGYFVQNDSIVISITNQPFTSYIGSNYTVVSLFDAIRWKGHYANNWNYAQYANSGENNTYLQASSLNETSEALVLVFGVGGNSPIPNMSPSIPFTGVEVVGELGGQIDFQVMSFIGYYTTFEGYSPEPIIYPPPVYFVYTGQSSEWSNTQTLTIPASISSNSTISTSPTPTFTSTPTVPEFTYCTITIVAMFGIITTIALVFKKIGHPFRA